MQPRPAVVSIMADGSVMVTTAGMEMGQGMFTKVKQVSSAASWTTALKTCEQSYTMHLNPQLSCMLNVYDSLLW